MDSVEDESSGLSDSSPPLAAADQFLADRLQETFFGQSSSSSSPSDSEKESDFDDVEPAVVQKVVAKTAAPRALPCLMTFLGRQLARGTQGLQHDSYWYRKLRTSSNLFLLVLLDLLIILASQCSCSYLLLVL